MAAIGMIGLVAALTAAGARPAPRWLEQVATAQRPAYRIDAKGTRTNSNHPERPGDFATFETDLRIFHDPRTERAVVEFESGAEGERKTERYFVRGGRVSRVDDKGVEIVAERLVRLERRAVAHRPEPGERARRLARAQRAPRHAGR
jgi:hypothetical protein